MHPAENSVWRVQFPRLERRSENSSVRNESIELCDRVTIDDSIDPDLIAGRSNEFDQKSARPGGIIHPF